MEKFDTKLIRARLKLKPTEEGGRLSGIKSGYRPNHVFEYVEGQIITTFIGEIQFDDSNWIQPGEERIVNVKFLYARIRKYYQLTSSGIFTRDANRLVWLKCWIL